MKGIARPLVALVATSVIGSQQTLSSRIVLATVTDTGNRPLFVLGPDDFVVDERGEPREVLTVHLADYPIAVLLDNSSEARQQLDVIRSTAARFISRAGERPVAIAALATPDRLMASFDDDRAAVLAAVEQLGTASGPRLPLEAAATAAHAIRDTGVPFSAIVIISAGPAEVKPTEAGSLLTPILESGATIHVIATGSPMAAPASANDLLRALADQTRGQYTTIYSPASYSIALDHLADRLATEMMIEYVLPAGVVPGGDMRVGVKIPGAPVTGLGVR